jgi:hypothetical protein
MNTFPKTKHRRSIYIPSILDHPYVVVIVLLLLISLMMWIQSSKPQIRVVYVYRNSDIQRTSLTPITLQNKLSVANPPVTPVQVLHPKLPVRVQECYTALCIQKDIKDAAFAYGVSPTFLKGIAFCESSYHPNAYNPSGASGLFQFKTRTFYGNGGQQLWSPREQAFLAAKMFAHGQSWQWACTEIIKGTNRTGSLKQ